MIWTLFPAVEVQEILPKFLLPGKSSCDGNAANATEIQKNKKEAEKKQRNPSHPEVFKRNLTSWTTSYSTDLTNISLCCPFPVPLGDTTAHIAQTLGLNTLAKRTEQVAWEH